MEPGDPRGPGYYQATINSRMIAFSIRHPLASSSIGLPKPGYTNISTNSVRFSTRIGLNENAQHEGSQVNAFRHVLWQAEISGELGSSIAKQVGNLHEENAFAATGSNFKTSFKTLSEADQTIDLMNNVIGRAIGDVTEGKDMQFRAMVTLEYYNQNGLWTASPVTNKDGGITGYTISQTKLSQEQYNEAKKTLQTLDANGLNSNERNKRRESAKNLSEEKRDVINNGSKL
ncbi:hypothetical protein [Chryseobacterium sp. H1D6B]|uniref:DUF6973 domain-containing protein n=1 Tax=Chryseobacterium sp. H1D6B TaxID=2940588 RepID=UPI001849094D|nr:hypothetical protein [Chryseobacterium sp. H1D6B]